MRYPKTYYFVIIIFLVCSACKEKNNNEIWRSKLQGDWIAKSNEYDFLSVKDSLVYKPFYDYEKNYQIYRISNDSLIIPKYKQSFYLNSVSKKYIWTKDSDGDQAYPLFINSNIFHNDNISIKSLQVRFINQFNHGLVDWLIYFDEELNCYMDVNSVLIHYSTKNPLLYSKGLYYTRLSESEFEYYESKYKNIPLTKIRSEYISDNYFPGITCFGTDPTALFFECEYTVNNINKTNHLKFIIKGTRGMPNYLNVFIFHLFKMCNDLDFKRAEKYRYFKLYSSEYSAILK